MTFDEMVMRYDPDEQMQHVNLFPNTWTENATLSAISQGGAALLVINTPSATGGLVQAATARPTNDNRAVICSRGQTEVRIPGGSKVYFHSTTTATIRGSARMWRLPK